MKKRFSLMLMALMVLSTLVLAACGGSEADLSDSKYVGTWKISEISLMDESEEFDENWQLVLNGDGTGQSIDAEETQDFTWELTDNGFKTKGAVKLTFEDDGDNIKASLFGVELVFIKQ